MVEVVIPSQILAVPGVYVACRAGSGWIGDFTQSGSPATERLPMRAGLEGPNSAIGPSSQDGTHDAMQVLAGQLPNVIEHYTMPNIKEGVTPVQTGLRGIGRITLSRSRAVGSSRAAVPRGPLVNGVAVGVIRIEQQAMTDLLFKRYLKRIVVGIDDVAPVAQVAVVVVGKTEVRRRSRSTAPVAGPGTAKIIFYDRAEW